MVVINSKDPKFTWVWMDASETRRERRGHWNYTIVLGTVGPYNRAVVAELRDDEVIQSIIQGDDRGLLMHRHVAMLNGLHAG